LVFLAALGASLEIASGWPRNPRVNDLDQTHCFTAFEGPRRIASGARAEVALKAKEVLDMGEHGPVLIFDDVTGEQIEVDLRGTPEEARTRLAATSCEKRTHDADRAQPEPEAPRGPGRPKLGVVAREVTLLPRHWDWLGGQPGGASVALRKLVEEARRVNKGKDRLRRAQEATYRFMSAIAGNLPGFEEATRALFANNPERLEELIRGWPADIRTHVMRLIERDR
jgi:uncharacterized protein